MDLEAILAQLDDPAALSDQELDALLSDLQSAAEGVAEDNTDEALADLERIAAAVDVVRSEQAARVEAAADRAERARAAMDRIRGADADADEVEGDTDDPEPGVEATDDVPEPEPEPELVPAGRAPAAASVPRVTRVAARRPQAAQPRPAASTVRDLGLRASANLPGVAAGQPLRDERQLGDAIIHAVQASAGYVGQGAVKVPVAGVNVEDQFPRERYLTTDARENARKIDAVTGRSAIVASGGACAPLNVRYDLPTEGTEARPVRDQMLTRFGADRGGVRLLPRPVLSDLGATAAAAGISFWTNTNDISPSNPTTKPCLTMTCPNETETMVEAVTKCLEVGNFRQRFWPEQVAAWVALQGIYHAREAETRLLTTLGGLCTNITAGEVLGTIRNVLAVIDRAATQMRNFHRLGRNYPLQFAAPEWLLDQVRTDVARQLPVGTMDETLAVADAAIERWFAARRVNTTWFLDGEAGQVFAAQGAGALLNWPDSVVTYLYPAGSFLFLDGGSLDLGIYRDSTLVGTNDFRMFSETFEGVAFDGIEAYRLSIDVCPEGTVSSTVDLDICTLGS